MKAIRIVVTGRVQGVGFRDWMVAQARLLGVGGWVRNRGTQSVEAVAEGEDGAVDALIAAARRGPPSARVDGVVVSDAPASAGRSRSSSAFMRAPSVPDGSPDQP